MMNTNMTDPISTHMQHKESLQQCWVSPRQQQHNILDNKYNRKPQAQLISTYTNTQLSLNQLTTILSSFTLSMCEDVYVCASVVLLQGHTLMKYTLNRNSSAQCTQAGKLQYHVSMQCEPVMPSCLMRCALVTLQSDNNKC